MDHGFDPTDPTVQWFDSLTRPDAPADHKDWRCCGKGDAYRIRIDQDAAGEEGDTQGTAVVTDSAAITFPDGEKREPRRYVADFFQTLTKVSCVMSSESCSVRTIRRTKLKTKSKLFFIKTGSALSSPSR